MCLEIPKRMPSLDTGREGMAARTIRTFWGLRSWGEKAKKNRWVGYFPWPNPVAAHSSGQRLGRASARTAALRRTPLAQIPNLATACAYWQGLAFAPNSTAVPTRSTRPRRASTRFGLPAGPGPSAGKGRVLTDLHGYRTPPGGSRVIAAQPAPECCGQMPGLQPVGICSRARRLGTWMQV